MTTVKVIVLVATLIYFSGCAGMYFFQRKLIYYPTPYIAVDGLQETTLTNAGVKLQGYIANDGQEHLLLYFGGNAERVALSIAELAPQLPSVTIISFDYRGYGNSEGRPGEEALYQDALAQYETFAKEFETVSVLGRSLGGGVATYLASERPVDSLILVTPFDSVARVAADIYWYFPVSGLIKDKFDSASRADDISAPTLLLIAADDRIVPDHSTERLRDQFDKNLVTSLRIEDVGHNTIGSSPLYGEYIWTFLQQTVSENQPDS